MAGKKQKVCNEVCNDCAFDTLGCAIQDGLTGPDCGHHAKIDHKKMAALQTQVSSISWIKADGQRVTYEHGPKGTTVKYG